MLSEDHTRQFRIPNVSRVQRCCEKKLEVVTKNHGASTITFSIFPWVLFFTIDRDGCLFRGRRRPPAFAAIWITRFLRGDSGHEVEVSTLLSLRDNHWKNGCHADYVICRLCLYCCCCFSYSDTLSVEDLQKRLVTNLTNHYVSFSCAWSCGISMLWWLLL